MLIKAFDGLQFIKTQKLAVFADVVQKVIDLDFVEDTKRLQFFLFCRIQPQGMAGVVVGLFKKCSIIDVF